MELYRLKTFRAVAEEGTLTRAARHLNSSQPKVSAHIKAFEEALGLRLLHRSRRGMAPTEQGRALLPRVEGSLSSLAMLEEEAMRLGEAITG